MECRRGTTASNATISFIVHDLVMVHMLATDTQYHDCLARAAASPHP